tara:strand:+ start:319 stop:549 length:231 start_codon:yes stop_codon:yes gene_type:complete
MVEYVVGPVLACLLAVKFGDWQAKKKDETITALETRIEQLEAKSGEADQEMAKKVMATVLPIAKAVQKLNTEVGIR